MAEKLGVIIELDEQEARRLITALVYGSELLQRKSAHESSRSDFYEVQSTILSELYEQIEEVLK